MSTLAVNTITNASGGQSITLSDAVGKAYAALDGSTSTAKASYNVTTIDDDGTGDWGINFTNTMGSAEDWVVVCSGGDDTHQLMANDGQSAGAAEIHCREASTANTDAERTSTVVFGDLS